MEIVWYGMTCFRLSERGQAAVVTDPYDRTVGLTLPRLKADVVTTSHGEAGQWDLSAAKGGARLVTGPGEYEIGGVFITGTALAPDRKRATPRNTVFVFNYEGLTLCHLGALSFVPTQAQVEPLGAINVLLLPVGGGESLQAAQAAEVVSLLEPELVVPMQYKVNGASVKLDPVEKFLKEMGLGELPVQDSLKVVKSGLPEETQVVLLQARQ